MPIEVSGKSGLYLYAIIEGAEQRNFGKIGINESEVYSITNGRVSAIVSGVSEKKIRPQRRNLGAHQAVLKRTMEEITPLPMAFGMIADGTESIKKILFDNQDVFADQLRRVSGKVEMGMRVSFDVSNIFEYFVSTHPELRAARDRHFGGYHEPSQEAKLELGRMFDRILNEEREEQVQRVEDVLGPYCYEIKSNKCRTENEVMKMACLVGRDEQEKFEEGIFEAARIFDNNYSFEYNGPWAPHNFVDIQLKL